MKKHSLFLISGWLLLSLLVSCSPAKQKTGADAYLSTDTLAVANEAIQVNIEKGTYAGLSTMILADGEVIDRHNYGFANLENQEVLEDNAIYRIYSMTKPIVTAALMTLYDDGLFQLDDEVAQYIPAFASTMVYTPEGLMPQEKPMTIRNLLTHTSGLTYGWDPNSYVDSLYRLERDEYWYSQTLEQAINHLAALPLKYQPGTKYEYSLSIDVAGYLVEVLSGESLDAFLSERIFAPLKMEDSGFYVPEEKKDRLVTVYITQADGSIKAQENPNGDRFLEKPVLFSGGGGLVSTMDDYARFATMLLNKGELDGVRVLSEDAVQLITTAQLPEGIELWEGYSYGLGGSVNLETGDYGWGGAASTAFRIFPNENITIMAFAQLMPANFGYSDAYIKKVHEGFKK